MEGKRGVKRAWWNSSRESWVDRCFDDYSKEVYEESESKARSRCNCFSQRFCGLARLIRSEWIEAWHVRRRRRLTGRDRRARTECCGE